MARNYNFGDDYTPERAYAPPAASFQRGSYRVGEQGGSAARVPEWAPMGGQSGVRLEQEGGSSELRAGQIMENMREAAGSMAEPLQHGFQASKSGAGAFAGADQALASAQGNAAKMALSGTSQALLDRSQGRADLEMWKNQEQRAMQAHNEQQADSRKKKGGGGILGAIGTIAGSIIGGPIGAGIGALGGLFG